MGDMIPFVLSLLFLTAASIACGWLFGFASGLEYERRKKINPQNA